MQTMLNIKNKDEKDNHTMIMFSEVARILKISTATVKLWSDMGLLQTSISPRKHRMVRQADVPTSLPEDNRPLSFLMLSDNEPARAKLTRQNRKKLAKINVKAITELTKQSVFKIDHLGSSSTATNRECCCL